MKSKIAATLIILAPSIIIYSLFNPSDNNTKTNDHFTKVVFVTDGDSITIDPGLNGEHHVRYLGVDTTERGEPYYTKATEFNKKLVLHKKVKVKSVTLKSLDHYFRSLALVYLKQNDTEILVNVKLLKEGLAWIYLKDIQYTDIFDELKAAQLEAMEKRTNLWSRINMGQTAYLDDKISIFHLKSRCKNYKHKSETTVKNAFLNFLSPCKKCRSTLWTD